MNEEEIKKVEDLLKEKFPHLNNEEIKKNATQLLELGYFIVRLRYKQHLKAIETHKEEELEAETEHPP